MNKDRVKHRKMKPAAIICFWVGLEEGEGFGVDEDWSMSRNHSGAIL
jgi:hypothetical protein